MTRPTWNLRWRIAAALLVLSLSIVASGVAVAAVPGLPTFTDPAKAGPDYELQGEYVGEITLPDGKVPYGTQVIALGDGKFEAVAYPGGLPGAGWDPELGKLTYTGKLEGSTVSFEGEVARGKLIDGVIHAEDLEGNPTGDLKKVERKSPTLGAKPPEGAVVLFDGTSAEAFPGGKMTSDGLLEVGCKSKETFKDFTMHIEFCTPFMPTARGQARGNSGVYLQDRYEVQVLDSFGLEGKNNECGGIYGIQNPKVNMCLPPLAWQTYDVDFTAAEFDDAGKKTKNAVLTLKHNGVPVYENYELPQFTPGGAPQEAPGMGPLMLQNHGNPVRFRNIWVVRKK